MNNRRELIMNLLSQKGLRHLKEDVTELVVVGRMAPQNVHCGCCEYITLHGKRDLRDSLGLSM